jgi:hypothetical protein
VTLYYLMTLLKAKMLVIASLLNHTRLAYPFILARWFIVMTPPLLLSCMILSDLEMSVTSSLLQTRSMVD